MVILHKIEFFVLLILLKMIGINRLLDTNNGIGHKTHRFRNHFNSMSIHIAATRGSMGVISGVICQKIDKNCSFASCCPWR